MLGFFFNHEVSISQYLPLKLKYVWERVEKTSKVESFACVFNISQNSLAARKDFFILSQRIFHPLREQAATTPKNHPQAVPRPRVTTCKPKIPVPRQCLSHTWQSCHSQPKNYSPYPRDAAEKSWVGAPSDHRNPSYQKYLWHSTIQLQLLMKIPNQVQFLTDTKLGVGSIKYTGHMPLVKDHNHCFCKQTCY